MKEWILFTNISEVSIGPVRTHSNALLLTDYGNAETGPRYRAIGFHTQATNPTFNMVLTTIKHVVRESPPGSLHSVLEFLIPAGRTPVSMTLVKEFPGDDPIDVQRWEADDKDDDGVIMKIWEVLQEKVVRYHNAPFIMIGIQYRTDELASKMGILR